MSTGALSTPEEVKDVKVDPAAASEWSFYRLTGAFVACFGAGSHMPA